MPVWAPCRRGKGTHRALDRAQHYLRRQAWYLKTDVVKFFPSVDHAVLLDLLGRRLRDRPLLELIGRIIASGTTVPEAEAAPGLFPGDDLYALLRPHGLPIGNLSSQFFANVLLEGIDHVVKEELRVPGYVRYCDDLVLFGDDKAELWSCHRRLEAELAGMRLRLHGNKTQLRPGTRGLKFLGFVLWPEQRRLQQGALKRLNRQLRRWRWLQARGLLDRQQRTRSLRAWHAHLADANSAGIQAALRRRWRGIGL